MKKSRIIGVAIILVILFIVGLSQRFDVVAHETSKQKLVSNSSDTPVIWPTDEWPTSTPEAQGMDSEKLVEMFEFIEEQKDRKKLNGLLVIRNGHIIAEKYHFPFHETFPHNTYSVTKSLTSALTGIALEEGYFTLDERVLDYFPEMTFENMSEEKENMTVEQLLLMTTGIEWPERTDIPEEGAQVFYDWESSDNQLQYYLDQPIIEEQVGQWNYDTGAVFVLGAIIEKATGKSLLEYGTEKIFNKIGMESIEFRKSKEGITNAGTYSHMTPRDMARFGYLYLHDGNWNGEQIVPKDWVQESVMKAKNREGRVGYGYYFWLNEIEEKWLYFAGGAYQQYIIIVPEEDLIIVQTADDFDIYPLIADYIFPSIQSDSPLPEKKQAYKKLKELMEK